MGVIHQILTADESKALAAYRKMVEEQRKLADGIRNAKNESKKHDEQVEKLGGTMGRFASYFGPTSLIASGIALWKRGLEEVDITVQRMTDNVKESAQSLAAFSMMQQGGDIRKRVEEAMALGNRYGAMPGESWATVQSFQARTGSFDTGMNAAMATFALKEYGAVGMEGARTAVNVGMGLGMTPEDAARAAYSAGKASSLTPDELAQMAGGGLPAYASGIKGGAVTAYSVAAALSAIHAEPGKLGTYTRQIGQLVQQQTGAVGKTWKQLGFKPGEEVDVEQRLQALYDAGIRTSGQLQMAGFAKKESQGLMAVLADWETSRQTMANVRKYYSDTDIMYRERAAAEQELPELLFQRKLEETDAQIKALETIGDKPQWALQRDLWEAELARRATERGKGYWPFVKGPPERRRTGRLGRELGGFAGIFSPEELSALEAARMLDDPNYGNPLRYETVVDAPRHAPLSDVERPPLTPLLRNNPVQVEVVSDRAPVAGRRGGR